MKIRGIQRYPPKLFRTRAGDELIVARGGQGGIGAVAPMEGAFQHGQNRQQVDDDDIETIFVEDIDWKADTKGAPGAHRTRTHLLPHVEMTWC